jgi:hypothetical protein
MRPRKKIAQSNLKQEFAAGRRSNGARRPARNRHMQSAATFIVTLKSVFEAGTP